MTQTALAMIANSKKEEKRLKMGEEKSCGSNTCMKELDVCTRVSQHPTTRMRFPAMIDPDFEAREQ